MERFCERVADQLSWKFLFQLPNLSNLRSITQLLILRTHRQMNRRTEQRQKSQHKVLAAWKLRQNLVDLARMNHEERLEQYRMFSLSDDVSDFVATAIGLVVVNEEPWNVF